MVTLGTGIKSFRLQITHEIVQNMKGQKRWYITKDSITLNAPFFSSFFTTELERRVFEKAGQGVGLPNLVSLENKS